MKKYFNEVVVGLFVVACLGLLIFMYARLKGRGTGGGIVVYGLFESAAGLIEGNPVTVSGVKVGRVGRITLSKGKARVELVFGPEVVLHRDAQAGILPKSLLGEKYVSVSPGSLKAARLKTGDRIRHIDPNLDIADLFRAIGPLTRSIERLGPEIRPLAKELTTVLRKVNRALGSDSADTKELVRNLNRILKDGSQAARRLNRILGANERDLRSTVRGARRLVQSKELKRTLKKVSQAAGRLPGVVDRADQLVRRLDRLAAAVPKDALGDLKGLLRDARGAVKELKAVLGTDRRSSARRLPRIVRNLDLLLARLARIDEADVREFLQVEGIGLSMSKSAARKKVRRLRRKAKRKTGRPSR